MVRHASLLVFRLEGPALEFRRKPVIILFCMKDIELVTGYQVFGLRTSIIYGISLSQLGIFCAWFYRRSWVLPFFFPYLRGFLSCSIIKDTIANGVTLELPRFWFVEGLFPSLVLWFLGRTWLYVGVF